MVVRHGDPTITTAGILTVTIPGILTAMILFITIPGITGQEFLFG